MSKMSGVGLVLPFLLFPSEGWSSPDFTGEVSQDFEGADVFTYRDPGGIDVGVPLAFPAGVVSGNDIEDVRFMYEASSQMPGLGKTMFLASSRSFGFAPKL